MHTRGGGTDQRDLGVQFLKERHIVSPSRRSKNSHRNRSSRQAQDEGDIRFFEMERSQSRDRNEGPPFPPPPNYISPPFQRYEGDVAHQRTPARPMSLLNNPSLGTTTANLEGKVPSALSSSSATTLSQGARAQSLSCTNFLKGECRFGSKCRFKHIVGVGLESTTITNDQK
jgi:hypothetical protein